MKKSNLNEAILIFLLIISFVVSMFVIVLDSRTTNVEKRMNSVQTVFGNNHH